MMSNMEEFISLCEEFFAETDKAEQYNNER